jgi:hypothetical protein
MRWVIPRVGYVLIVRRYPGENQELMYDRRATCFISLPIRFSVFLDLQMLLEQRGWERHDAEIERLSAAAGIQLTRILPFGQGRSLKGYPFEFARKRDCR